MNLHFLSFRNNCQNSETQVWELQKEKHIIFHYRTERPSVSASPRRFLISFYGPQRRLLGLPWRVNGLWTWAVVSFPLTFCICGLSSSHTCTTPTQSPAWLAAACVSLCMLGSVLIYFSIRSNSSSIFPNEVVIKNHFYLFSSGLYPKKFKY